MFTLKAFEHWAVGEKDHKGEIITEQRINDAHKDLFEKHPKDLPMVIRKMVMGFFRMEPLEFEKKHLSIIYAASMAIKKMENLPMSSKKPKIRTTHLDAELREYREICLFKGRVDLALALYKRDRISAESYANFCVEFFDTSVDKPAPTTKQVITPKQIIAPKQAIAPKQDPAPRKLLPSQQVLQHTSTSPPPSYTPGLYDSPTVLRTIGMPTIEPSFTAELGAAPVKAKPVLLPPPTNSVTKIKTSVGDTKFDAELREYTQLCLKSKGDLAYALYLRGRFSEEEYTKFCAEYREGDVPK
ncbi:hypothetical protein BOTCAL_0262g00050 [Botryotinia calthae]|uniref:Uncharacterized protein n=1 Tax=Botryotinia calthae TaxID=38488 RepID=A0A4Y8CW21_9HELO|nr:hypothetical protein BOTCAL_0262g00050 [Botryotinia calthae]